MDTWKLLGQELKYHGIELISYTKCRIYDENEQAKIQGVIKTIRDLNQHIKKQKKILLLLWNEVISVLSEQNNIEEIIDDRMINLFIFSLKDMVKFLLCFDNAERSKYYNVVSSSLTRDIKSFSREQVYVIPDYKISIDWISRTISRLLYISKLLAFAAMGPKKVSKYDIKAAVSKYEIKTAKGISGPWAHLDLPLLERVFPFGDEVQQREKGKQKQRRYTKGLQNYNNTEKIFEGHYWRELKNEPFSWFDRENEDPYPHRSLLNR